MRPAIQGWSLALAPLLPGAVRTPRICHCGEVAGEAVDEEPAFLESEGAGMELIPILPIFSPLFFRSLRSRCPRRTRCNERSTRSLSALV